MEPITPEEICNEYIFDNRYICSGKEPLQPKLLKMSKKVVNDMMIGDIMSNQGNILTIQKI